MSSSKKPPAFNHSNESAVPSGRFARLSRFGALATTAAVAKAIAETVAEAVAVADFLRTLLQ